MPYPPHHRLETKTRIVDSARRLFNRFGFDGVSVEQIMAEAGLTHGGFYRYFVSKSDLYAEVMQCFFTDPRWRGKWEGVHLDSDAPDAAAQIVRAYLSPQHLAAGENSCPLAALPNDVARSSDAAKRAYQEVFEAMVRMLQPNPAANGSDPRTAALAIAALCIGGMVVARASNGHPIAEELRAAALETALRLGGWEEAAAAQPISAKRRGTKAALSSARRLRPGQRPTA